MIFYSISRYHRCGLTSIVATVLRYIHPCNTIEVKSIILEIQAPHNFDKLVITALMFADKLLI